MKFKFKINKYYLLIHALGQADLPFPEWVNLQNRLWEKFPKSFYLLTFHSEIAFIGREPLKGLSDTCQEAKRLIQEALKSKEFQRLYRESKDYLSLVKKQWAKNQKKALSILEDLSGLKLPKRNITVLITYPKLYRSFALSNYNIISLGYAEDWENSSTVYLCHEIMHFLTKNTKIIHALIKLMTDNELRIKLNKKGKYFIFQKPPQKKDHPLYDYFDQIWQLEKKIYPYWKEYLKDKKGRNIFDLEKEIKCKIKEKP